MLRFPILLSLVSLACSAAPSARSHSRNGIEGRWEGTVRAFGAEGKLIVDFITVSDTIVALTTMHSEALWLDKRLVNVSYNDPRVHFEFPSRQENGVFDGVLSGDSITGVTRKGPRALPMVFRRLSKEVPAKPYRREVFGFRSSDGTQLEGALAVPLSDGPHPAVVFLHGSGPGERDDHYYLADVFARAGFAALSYDKRGSGRSRGTLEGANFQDFAADARAAIESLAARADIDARRIGIAGISEGGWVAPIVASSELDRTAFVIAIVASGGTYFTNALYQNLARMERFGANAGAMARYRELVIRVSDVARGTTVLTDSTRQALNTELREAHREPWARVTDLPRGVPESRDLRRLRWTMLDFDPAGHWSRVRAPVLLVLGARDRNVNSAEAVERIRSALQRGGNRDFTVVMYPDVEHDLMTVADTTREFRFPAPPPGYPDTLASWAGAKVKAPTRRD